jgi:hypothetical protein
MRLDCPKIVSNTDSLYIAIEFVLEVYVVYLQAFVRVVRRGQLTEVEVDQSANAWVRGYAY